MKNVEMKLDGDGLTITVDLSREFGPSSSGKTVDVAGTTDKLVLMCAHGGCTMLAEA